MSMSVFLLLGFVNDFYTFTRVLCQSHDLLVRTGMSMVSRSHQVFDYKVGFITRATVIDIHHVV